MRYHVVWMLAVMIVVQACAKDEVVHPPAVIRVLTKADLVRGAPVKDSRLAQDAAVLDPVLRVSSRLVAAARHSAYGLRAHALCWTIAVFDDPAPRAFVQPDGAIVVSTGTFRLAENEAGLAAVLAHELVRALANNDPLSPPCHSTHEQPPPVSTYQEALDADAAGVILMADAGYDPRELLRLWERMKFERQVRERVYEYVNYDRRMEQIAQRLPVAIMRYERTNRAPQKKLP